MLSLPTLGLILVIVLGVFLVLRMLLDMRQRIVAVVSRPTTRDGETIQLSANIRAAADSAEIGELTEKLSLSIQRRLVHQNEIEMQAQVGIGHERWKRIREKLDTAEAEGRRGLGILSMAERRWWNEHAKDFDADGPKATTTDATVQAAASSGE